MNFACQLCNTVCDWDTRRPTVMALGEQIEVKTVGNRFCNEPACINEEARVNGLPVEHVMKWHPQPKGQLSQTDRVALEYLLGHIRARAALTTAQENASQYVANPTPDQVWNMRAAEDRAAADALERLLARIP